jgi:hypothetical protein
LEPLPPSSADAGGEEVIAQVEGLYAVDHRWDEMYAWVQRSGEHTCDLAYTHAAHAAGYDNNARSD